MIKDDDRISRNIKKAYDDKKYIVNYKTIYQPFYSVNTGYYATKVHYSRKGTLTRAGRYFHFTGDEVNHVLGYKLLGNL